MARKRKSSSPSLLLVFFLALIVLGAWLYQHNLRREAAPPAGPSTAQATGAPATVRIATWNLRHFGGQRTTDPRIISKIIIENHFDILAIQEVQRDGQGIDILLNELGSPWRSTSLSPESRSGERLDFIYRGDHVQEVGKPGVLPGIDADLFEREPYCATFRCGNFDFELITVHLTWGDADRRRDEAAELARLLPQVVASQKEKDLIVLGDFNEQRSKPNLHYLEANGWNTLVTEGTNLSSREIYDHILVNRTWTREYTGQTGVYRFDELLFGNQDKEAVRSVSDHRPAWADFSAIGPDDD